MVESIFPVGRPAGPDDVVDREEFIGEAVERLSLGHDIVLAGPRRLGKSSVAGAILQRLGDRGAATASVDVFRAPTVLVLATQLLEALARSRTGVRAEAARSIRELGRYLSQARVSAKLHDLELGVALAEPKLSPEGLLELALATAERIGEHDGRRMVVVIDEFQDIRKMGGAELLKQIRAAIQHQQHTAYLFTGSQQHLMTELFAKPDAAFFRFAIPMHLPSIPWPAWEQYLVHRLAAHGMTVSDSALTLLRERTGGHPHGVMVVMEAALVHTTLGGRTAIRADDVWHGYGASLDGGTLGAIYAQEWAALREYRHAAPALWTIADGGEPYAGAASRSGVTAAIRLLEARGLIVTENRGHHQLVEPMLGAWLQDQVRHP